MSHFKRKKSFELMPTFKCLNTEQIPVSASSIYFAEMHFNQGLMFKV